MIVRILGEGQYRLEDAELDSRSSTSTIYWEGPVRLKAADGTPVGRGYLELTGYAGELDL